jgi:recombinational DNA repair protein RecR
MLHFDLPHKVDRALVKELCRRSQREDKVIIITKTVRDASVIVEHQRYVDPPSAIAPRN